VTFTFQKIGAANLRTSRPPASRSAANVMLSRVTRFSSLKRWVLDVAKRRGLKRAKVALARKLATVLHRMWATAPTCTGASRPPPCNQRRYLSGRGPSASALPTARYRDADPVKPYDGRWPPQGRPRALDWLAGSDLIA
jgi:hypothetical protein